MQRRGAADARIRRSSPRCSPKARAAGRACRLRPRSTMPPSLISLSETPPAPARALVSMSASEWMPSSMPIGTLVAFASFFSPSRSSCGERLLDEHQSGLAGLLDVGLGRGQRQPAVGVGAQRHLRQRLAHRVRDRDFLGQRLHADLELQEAEAFLSAWRAPRRRRPRRSGCRAATSASRRCGAAWRRGRSAACQSARPIRSSSAISTAECAPPLPASARCMVLRRFRPGPRVLAGQQRREMIAHRRDQAALGVAGHGRRRGRFAPADGAVGGLDAHDQILRRGDGLGRHLHRRLERQRHRNGVDAADRSAAPHRRAADADTLARTFTVHTLKRGSRKSRRLSPNRLKANTARLIIAPGNRIIHGAWR